MLPWGKERVGGLAKQNKLKQNSEGKKKIGTTSLKQQGGCFSATDRPMMGKSEAFSVHIQNKVAKSGHLVATDRDAGCRGYHRSPWMSLRGCRWYTRSHPCQISHKLTLFLVHFILEYVEVVGRCHRDDVVLGMPSSVKDLLVEVQTINADFILLALPTCTHLAWF